MQQENMRKKDLLKLLEKENIDYILQEHQTGSAMEETEISEHGQNEAYCLFLKDEKNGNYYLIARDGTGSCSLSALRHMLGSGPLSDASEKDLKRILRIPVNNVNPGGILNDEKHLCEAVIDVRLRNRQIAVCPNRSKTEFLLKTEDLVSLIEKQGHSVHWADLDQIL